MRYPVPILKICEPSLSRFGAESKQDLYLFRVEEDIKRSRFITSLGRASDRVEARRFIDAVKLEFPDATHNCWAFAAGAPGDTADVGQSDDGEPHGTAGRPMLTQLLHGGVGEVVAVVTRYFGGVKLGTGGLVRAYQGCVANAMALLPVEEKTVPARVHVVLEYTALTLFHRMLPDFQARIIEEQFGADVEFVLEMPDDSLAAFGRALVESTDGHALLEPLADEVATSGADNI